MSDNKHIVDVCLCVYLLNKDICLQSRGNKHFAFIPSSCPEHSAQVRAYQRL